MQLYLKTRHKPLQKHYITLNIDKVRCDIVEMERKLKKAEADFMLNNSRKMLSSENFMQQIEQQKQMEQVGRTALKLSA